MQSTIRSKLFLRATVFNQKRIVSVFTTKSFNCPLQLKKKHFDVDVP